MDINERRERIRKWATVGLIGATGLIVAPIIFFAITGLLGLLVAGIIGSAIVTFAPVWSMKLANWKVKAIMAEAKENPIETMVNALAAKKIAFNAFKASVETAATARNTFKQKCEVFAKKYPHRAAEFQAQLERMVALVEKKKAALNDAQQSLEDGENKLEEMKAYWEMSKDAMELNEAAGMNTGDQFEKLKADTACDAVFESMNRAFAQLEVADSLSMDSVDKVPEPAQQLGHSEQSVVEVPVMQTRDAQKVRL